MRVGGRLVRPQLDARGDLRDDGEAPCVHHAVVGSGENTRPIIEAETAMRPPMAFVLSCCGLLSAHL